MKAHRRISLSTLLLAAVACASVGGQRGSKHDDVILRSELATVGSLTAYDAVQRLRPVFLADRGPVSLINVSARRRPVVFIDMTEFGELESLRTFPASRVEEVRFYPAQRASTKFGSIYTGGVIQLTMRVQ